MRTDEPDRENLEQIKEQIIETLKSEYARGSIGIEEYERLLIRTQNVATGRELELLADALPDFNKKTGNDPESSIDRYAGGKYAGGGYRDGHEAYPETSRDEDTFVAVLGNRHMKGVWYPPPVSKVFSFMGEISLDFTQAVLPCRVIEINVFCLLSDIKLRIPPEMSVVMSGVPILGSFEDKTRQSGERGGPVLKINGAAILSSVKVKD